MHINTVTENFTRCDPNPCMNGGNCSENIYGFECHCNDKLVCCFSNYFLSIFHSEIPFR